MTLDEMIYRRLRDAPGLQGLLAVFKGHAAVFNQKAADTADPGWGEKQYPRIDYGVDMQENPAMGTSGMLGINVFADSADAVEPEDLERAVRTLLDSTLAHPTAHPIHCFAWLRSDLFEEARDASNPNRRIVGYTLAFAITALPRQELFSPDPVLAIDTWTKGKHPNALVIGLDDIDPDQDGGWYVPTKEHPAIYWRIATLEPDGYMLGMTCVWMRGVLTGHVFGAHASVLMPLVFALEHEMMMEHHLRMDDGSPMRISGIKGDANQSYLPIGQLAVQIKYGVLPQHFDVEKLAHASNEYDYS